MAEMNMHVCISWNYLIFCTNIIMSNTLISVSCIIVDREPSYLQTSFIMKINNILSFL